MKRKIQLSEDSMLAAEAEFPKLAAEAGRAAHQRALLHSGKVVKALNGQVVEERADGTVRVLGMLQPATPVKKGLVLVRRMAR